MRVVTQADTACNHILSRAQRALDFGRAVGALGSPTAAHATLISQRAFDKAVACHRDLGAVDGDAARCHQLGGATAGQSGHESMGRVVVLDHGAVRVFGDGLIGVVAGGRLSSAVEPDDDHGRAQVAAGGQHDGLFTHGGRVPCGCAARAGLVIGAPVRDQLAQGYAHKRGLARAAVVHGMDAPHADHVVQQTLHVANGEGRIGIHAPTVPGRARARERWAVWR